MKQNMIMSEKSIQDHIYTIRNFQVMMDADLASMYEVETKQLNKAVSRNIDRFPERFRFQLTQKEYDDLRFQNGTSSVEHGGRRYLPYVFTEQGVSMLSAVLRSQIAIEVSIKIIDSFVHMRRFISQNALLFQKIDIIEKKQQKTDEQLEKVLNAIEDKSISKTQGIFFNGQIFDAYVFMSSLIREAKKSIVQKHNQQYANIELREIKHAHDRFLLIDEKIYHLGASLKDLGKKWFAFSLIEEDIFELKKRVSEVLDDKHQQCNAGNH